MHNISAINLRHSIYATGLHGCGRPAHHITAMTAHTPELQSSSYDRYPTQSNPRNVTGISNKQTNSQPASPRSTPSQEGHTKPSAIMPLLNHFTGMFEVGFSFLLYCRTFHLHFCMQVVQHPPPRRALAGSCTVFPALQSTFQNQR